jgi:hypothetical protein
MQLLALNNILLSVLKLYFKVMKTDFFIKIRANMKAKWSL